jgi:hypothetical protein
MTSVAIVIVNFNTRDLLRACLQRVSREAPDEVIVVDNASMDGSAEMVRAEFRSVILLESGTNLGYGASANLAIASCVSPYILLLNSDALLHPGAVGALSAYLEREPHVAIVGPRLLDSDGKLQKSCFPFPTPLDIFLDVSNLSKLIGLIPWMRDSYLRTWSHRQARAVPWIRGAALALRRTALEQVGGFDESFFMYYEEVDLCFRVARKGWQVHYTPVAEVTHLGGASTQQLRAEMTVQFYASLAKFYRRHYSKFRMGELFVLVNLIAAARLVRDLFLVRLTSNSNQRAHLGANIAAWQQLIHGHWHRQEAYR